MIEPVDIRYEADEIDPSLSGNLAILLMATDKGRIAVHMHRSVLVGLYATLGQVLESKEPFPQSR